MDNIEEKVAQDPDIKDKKGTQPKKYYSGLSKSTKEKRDAHFKKGASMDDDNPDAYKPAPGDKDSKTKESKHTKKYRDMYGEETINEDATAALKKKAEKSGISLSILRKVYNRGVAAWRTGHRPGTTPEQWGLARVNSFITKGKGTWGKADKDLASKVKKESVDESLKVTQAQIKGAAKSMSSNYIEKSSIDKVIALIKHIGKRVTMNKSNISKATYTVEGKKTFSSLRKEMVEPYLEEDLEEAAAANKLRKDGAQSVSVTSGEVSEEETQDEACWDGYKQVGMKKKGNKTVPNCVPEETDIEEAQIRTRAAHGDELKRREKISKALKGKKRKKTFSSMRSRLAEETEEHIQEAVKVSRKDFDKLKKGSMITIDYGSSVSRSNKRTFMVKGKSRSAKYNVDKVNMVDPNKPGGMKFHLYSRGGEDATLALGDMGATINSYSIKESIEEKRDAGKSATGYDIYHDTYSAAMQHAYAHAKKKHGVTVRPSEIDDKVASGPRKPSSGKTVSHILKTDKKQNLHVQVYNTGRKYELNMYVESVEVDEASILRTKTTRKQSDASKEKDRKKAVKTFQDIKRGKYPGVKFAEETLDEASIQDIQGILTTIAKSQNMNQAVQMVMKKYKVDQGKAKAMVKKAIDSGVTYDKIKKKYAKESVEMNEANAIDLARDVVKNKSAKKGLDMQTANAILTVYDKVNDANKKKMEKMPVAKLSSAVWKILGKAK